MALLAIINEEKYEALSDDLKEHYTKNDDGNFQLAVTGVDGYELENVAGLKKVLEEAKDERGQLKDKLKVFEGIEDPKAARKAIEDLAKLRDEISGWEPPEKWKATMDEREAQLIEKTKKEKDELQGELDSTVEQLKKVLIDAEAAAAINAAEGNVALLTPHVRATTRMEKDANGDYVARVIDLETGRQRISLERGSTDPMGIKELVETMKTTYPEAFKGTNQGGSGSPGSGGGTAPGQTMDWDEAKDPHKYRQMREKLQKEQGQAAFPLVQDKET